MLTRGMVVVIFIILLWQLLTSLINLPDYILPSPVAVAKDLSTNLSLIFQNLIPTLIETIVGLIFGVALGMLLALMMMALPWLSYWLLPVMVISQAIPTFAIAPILVLWFGYGIVAKVITVILMLFFPVASAFYAGLVKTNSVWLDSAKVMGGKKINILWHLQFRAALPNLATGIRLATALAPIGAIVSEWVGSSQGIGFLMLNANARLETGLMFACLVMIMFSSLLLYSLVDAILKSVIDW